MNRNTAGVQGVSKIKENSIAATRKRKNPKIAERRRAKNFATLKWQPELRYRNVRTTYFIITVDVNCRVTATYTSDDIVIQHVSIAVTWV